MFPYKKLHITIKLDANWLKSNALQGLAVRIVRREFLERERDAVLMRQDEFQCEFEVPYSEERRFTITESIKAALCFGLKTDAPEKAAVWEIFPLTESMIYQDEKEKLPSACVFGNTETAWRVTLELDGDYTQAQYETKLTPIEDFMSALVSCFKKTVPIRHTQNECELLISDATHDDISTVADGMLITTGATDNVRYFDISEVILIPQPQFKFNASSQNTDAQADADEEEYDEVDEVDDESDNAEIYDDTQIKWQQSTLKKIDALIGANEFKVLAHELMAIAPTIIESSAQEVFARRCYLFSLDDGCGFSTQLTLFDTLLRYLDIYSSEKTVECAADMSAEAMVEKSDTVLLYRIISYDLSAWISKVKQPAFVSFLRSLQRNMEKQLYVFRIPAVDEKTFADIYGALCNVFTVRAVAQAAESSARYCDYAQNMLKDKGFTLNDNARAALEERIAQERNCGRFFGFSTIKKIVDELIYEKLRRVSDGFDGDSKTQISRSCFDKANEMRLKSGSMCELDALVGMDGIRERIMEILAQIEIANTMSGDIQPCLHMRFVGNPGTGKTTVARIIGKLMQERGLLTKGKFFEYAGRDFCGQFIGETAPKTAEICREAYGSVLFINEAYSLFRGDKDNRDFGREAIDTLIAQIENHRNDFMVIMSGYTDDMETLMTGNAGLAGRMPYVLEFPNYTRNELFLIFKQMSEKAFSVEPALMDAARKYFNALSSDTLNSKQFSNARFVRNLFERTWAKASLRHSKEADGVFTLCAEDFSKAIADKEFSKLLKSKKEQIGF